MIKRYNVENKAKLSDSLKKNVTPKKNFKKNPINGTKFTIMVSSAKGGVGKSTFAINLTFALQKKGKKKLDCWMLIFMVLLYLK